MTNAEVLELYNKKRELFLSARTKQEMQVSAWAEKISKLDPGVLESVELPKEITLQVLIPELYVDEPNQEIYEQQYAKVTELFEKVNNIAAKYNEEAIKCLSDYKEISSSQL